MLSLGTLENPHTRTKRTFVEVFNFMEDYPGKSITINTRAGLTNIANNQFRTLALIVMDKNMTFASYGNSSDKGYLNFTDKGKS